MDCDSDTSSTTGPGHTVASWLFALIFALCVGFVFIYNVMHVILGLCFQLQCGEYDIMLMFTVVLSLVMLCTAWQALSKFEEGNNRMVLRFLTSTAVLQIVIVCLFILSDEPGCDAAKEEIKFATKGGILSAGILCVLLVSMLVFGA